MVRTRILSAFAWLLPAMLCAADDTHGPPAVVPPQPAREFRGAWLVTVANKDWPSSPGLSVAEQKAELTGLLDRAVQLKLNAIIFQVRPSCDAMYASSIEPWSEYLTGTMGRAQQPFYDPLAFAIAEAHKRGLELHAWFNPFRARDAKSRSPVAPNHISRTHPEWVCQYGSQFWLDPGGPSARAYVLSVIMDVVRRYDVDGVHFDDYFYPYPEKDPAGRELGFPDDASWRKYGASSGLSRDDWRRQNINLFVQSVYQNIKAAKPRVKFGISPFGIWRPGVPAGISPKALDAYDRLYADARLWLANGWVDYLAPQLYWAVADHEHSFPALLQWWCQQNVKGRHVFAGLNDAAVGKTFSTDEIPRQIQADRAQSGNGGEIHFHLRSLVENPALADAVRAQYAQPALVPTAPWIAATPPLKPRLKVDAGTGSARVRWESSGGEPPRNWLLQSRANGVWTTQIFPAGRPDCYLDNGRPDAVVLRAVDRLGNLGEAAIWSPKKYSLPDTTRGAQKMKK